MNRFLAWLKRTLTVPPVKPHPLAERVTLPDGIGVGTLEEVGGPGDGTRRVAIVLYVGGDVLRFGIKPSTARNVAEALHLAADDVDAEALP